MTSGIYEIVHTVSGTRYIGQSRQIEFRWWCHRVNLDRGIHDNRHLQNAWRRDGCEAFVFRVVELCDESMLLEREQVYLDLYWGSGLYNLAREAHRPSMKGHSQSDYQKRRVSETHRGKTLSEETKQKLREANLGKKQSAETLAKKRGKKASIETRTKMSNARLGKRRSPEATRRTLETKNFLAACRRITDRMGED